MANDEHTGEDAIDWRLTTFDGARREQMRRWAELPLERILAAIEEIDDVSERVAAEPEQTKRRRETP